MKPLPLDAHWQDLTHAIMAAQRRCRIGLVRDPLALAKRVRRQVDRVCKVAAALGSPPEALVVNGQFFEKGHLYGLTTVVVVDSRGLTVERREPSTRNGQVDLTIGEAWS